jgi:tetratricopeptide (TPR) repeat protein
MRLEERIHRRASEMSPARAEAAERSLRRDSGDSADSDDVETRAVLCLFYQFAAATRPWRALEYRRLRREHQRWLLANNPQAEVLQVTGVMPVMPIGRASADVKAQLHRQVAEHPADVAASINAAVILRRQGDWDGAETAARQAVAADPGSKPARRCLAETLADRVHWDSDNDARGSSAEELGEKAAEALGLLKDLASSYPQLDRGSHLTTLAKCALLTGNVDIARRAAEDLLAVGQAGGPSEADRHHAHLILGRLALVDGDIHAALAELEAMAQHVQWQEMWVIGPNMDLAARLFEIGRTEAVMEYLEVCRRSCRWDRGRIKRWKRDLRAGRTPRFGTRRW